MTRVFDDVARETLRLNVSLFEENIDENVKPKDLQVRQVPAKTLRPYIAAGHYSQTFPDSTREAFAGFYGMQLVAGVTFGMGANNAAFNAIVPDIGLGEYRELTRLWVDDECPKNTASRLVAQGMKGLPSKVKLVLSFADSGQGHAGYVYQALNFYYLGTTVAGRSLIDEDGDTVHPRLLGIYRIRRSEFSEMSSNEIAEKLGWHFVDGSIKHRYAIAVGDKRQRKELSKVLESKSLPYPKLNMTGE